MPVLLIPALACIPTVVRADAVLVSLTPEAGAKYGYSVRTVEAGKKKLVYLELSPAAVKSFGHGDLTLTKSGQTMVEATVTIVKDAKGNGTLKLAIDPAAVDGGELTISSSPIEGVPLVKNFGGFRLSISDILDDRGAVEAPLNRGGPRLTVRMIEQPARDNWHYQLQIASEGLEQHFAIRNGQPITREDIRLVDVNGDGFLDIMVVGGKDHRGEAWFKTWVFDAKDKKYRWINEIAASSPKPRPEDKGGAGDLAPAQTRMQWKRLAAKAIRTFLHDRKDLADLVAKRLDSAFEHMEVVDPGGTSQAIEYLRKLPQAMVPKIDPKNSVAVYLNGPAGGAWRLAVVFNRTDATAKAVVFIPGK